MAVCLFCGPSGAYSRDISVRMRLVRARQRGASRSGILRERLYRAPGYLGRPGGGADATPDRDHRGGRRPRHQERVLGPQEPRLPDQEESQGALLAAQYRWAERDGGRIRAQHAAQRGRAALSHRPRRRARREPLDHDDPRLPRRSRPRPAAAVRRPGRPRTAPGRKARHRGGRVAAKAEEKPADEPKEKTE